jgi:hypothetical protein
MTARYHFPRRKQGEPTPWPVEAVNKYLSWDDDGRRDEFDSDLTSLPTTPRAALVRHLMDGCDFASRSTASTRVHHWYRRGLSDYEADMLAVSLGHHPVDIWPEWFDGVDLDAV